MRKIVAIAVTLLLLGYAGISWYFSGLILFAGSEPYTAAAATAEVAEVGLTGIGEPELLTVVNDGVTVAGSYYENPAPAGCAVLALHGRGGNRLGSFWFAKPFWEQGCHFLAFDSRGFGSSDPADQTYGFYEKEDAVLMYQWLLDRTGLPPEDVGLIGVSYGAAVSLQALSLRDDMAFVVADSPYQSLTQIVTDQGDIQFGSWTRMFLPGAFWLTEQRADMNVAAVAPLETVRGAQTPILLIHAREDAYTLASHSEAIYANSNPATTELVITDWGAAHGRSVLVDYEGYTTLLADFIQAQAPDFGAQGKE
ncbi:MAG: alpha/beta fold hydrolase [Anaerolineales bacterium]|nr:alpha/beta fold hydrolase [Anaerolineales bacterium]